MRFITPTSADVSGLQRLMRATVTETYGHQYRPEDLAHYLDTAYATDRLVAELEDERNFWQLVVDDADGAVAYVNCQPAHLPHADLRPGRDGQLERIYVLRSEQGRGLGKRLLTVALEHLSARYGDAPQWLGVWSENFRAQSLYRAHGFEKAGEYEFEVGNAREREFILRRLP